ncbi:hypothetical protein O0L34_g7006 [Tuta absoluta]|nr:hypothetical protein O0L34_g7006 [Tuta absoluta]
MAIFLLLACVILAAVITDSDALHLPITTIFVSTSERPQKFHIADYIRDVQSVEAANVKSHGYQNEEEMTRYPRSILPVDREENPLHPSMPFPSFKLRHGFPQRPYPVHMRSARAAHLPGINKDLINAIADGKILEIGTIVSESQFQKTYE